MNVILLGEALTGRGRVETLRPSARRSSRRRQKAPSRVTSSGWYLGL